VSSENPFSQFLSWLQSDAANAAIAGAAGGLVRWLTLRDNPRDGIASLIVGAVCAIYLGPIVEPMLRPVFGAISPGRDPQGFAAFVVGLGGIGLAGFVIEVLRQFSRVRGDRNE